MYRRAIQQIARGKKGLLIEQISVKDVYGRLFHESRLCASPSMHGPGGQPSGTPVLNKSVKKQPTRDDAPSKGDQPVKDDPASQGKNANSTTGDSNPKLDPTSSGTRVTSHTPSKGFHTLTSVSFPHNSQSSSFHSSSLCAQAKGKGEFALADRQDSSRDTAAAAEAKYADRGVASGSTRKDAGDTGRPSESAPTASESVISNVQDKGLHGYVKDTQGNL